VRRHDVEAAVAPALNLGKMLFADIERDQFSPPTLAVLRCLASAGEAGGHDPFGTYGVLRGSY